MGSLLSPRRCCARVFEILHELLSHKNNWMPPPKRFREQGILKSYPKGSETFSMTSDRLGEMFEGDFADSPKKSHSSQLGDKSDPVSGTLCQAVISLTLLLS